VGRKFNQAILRRALCCRMHRFTGFAASAAATTTAGTGEGAAATAAAATTMSGTGEEGAASAATETTAGAGAGAAGRAGCAAAAVGAAASSVGSLSFALRHPAVMCTATPFDLGTYADGAGACFDSPQALVWAAEEGEGEAEGKGAGTGAGAGAGTGERVVSSGGGGGGRGGGRGGVLGPGRCEVLNGRTGESMSRPGAAPGVSRAALLALHRVVLAEVASCSAAAAAAGGEDHTAVPGEVAAAEAVAEAVAVEVEAEVVEAEAGGFNRRYGAWKRRAGEASGYAAAKRAALSQPGLWRLSALHHSLAPAPTM